MDFIQLGLNENLQEGLKKQGIEIPTPIQERFIPEFLKGIDIIGKSETGSGKTLAYLLPIFMKINKDIRGTQAIIITPTHELAIQVSKQAQELAENSNENIRTALIIGGANVIRQIEKLKEKPQIVVGSAGRILDLIKKKKIQAHSCKTIIIDEGDRMLDDLNFNDIKAIIKTTLASERQIGILSASIDEKTKSRAKEIMKTVNIVENEKGLLPKEIEHFCIVCDSRDKISILRKIYAGLKPKKTIVFINNPENIEVMVEKLNFHGLKTDGIYGLAKKEERKVAMDSFRSGKIDILIASDIGARGLDFEDVDIVLNIDISEDSVYYQHRAGRTGRKGNKGTVISLVTPAEKRWLNRYEKDFGIKILEKEMSFGNLVDITEKKKIYKKPKKSRK